MAIIAVNFAKLNSLEQTNLNLMNQIAHIGDRFSGLKNQLDWDISKANQIESKLSQLNGKIDSYEQAMREIANYVKLTISEFTKCELENNELEDELIDDEKGALESLLRDVRTSTVLNTINSFLNDDFLKDMSKYMKLSSQNFDDIIRFFKPGEGFWKTGGKSFMDSMDLLGNFQGWKQATTLGKVGKGAGILGLFLTLGVNAYDDLIMNDQPIEERLEEFGIDTAIDLGTGAGAMAAGAAIGTLIVPPIGTVVGMVAGLAIGTAINWEFGQPPNSLVGHTKDFAKEAVDFVQEGLSDLGAECADEVGKFLNKIFW